MTNKIWGKETEYIIAAAILRKEPKECRVYYKSHSDIYKCEIGLRHCDIFDRFGNELQRGPSAQGFMTSHFRFVDREEGMRIAIKSGQVCKKEYRNELFSEDLW